MIDLLRRHGFRVLIAAAVALGVAGVWIRPEEGIDRMPGFYPLTGIVFVCAVAFAVRALRPLLEKPEDETDAD